MAITRGVLEQEGLPLMVRLVEPMSELDEALTVFAVTDVKWKTWTDGNKDANIDHHFDE
jgi:hypothetical protein